MTGLHAPVALTRCTLWAAATLSQGVGAGAEGAGRAALALAWHKQHLLLLLALRELHLLLLLLPKLLPPHRADYEPGPYYCLWTKYCLLPLAEGATPVRDIGIQAEAQSTHLGDL